MSVKLFFWNVRGLNHPDKHRPFVDWLNSHKPLFGALLETHIKELNLSHLMSNLCRGWSVSTNHSSDDDGRIILIWRDPVKVVTLAQSRQMMTCEITIPNSLPIVYTAIYASNLGEERTDLWVELMNLHTSLMLDTKPWMIGGDFNQILFSCEHSLNIDNHSPSQMYGFRDCLLQLGAFDLRFQGPLFTWSNKQPDQPIAKKLDSQLVNNHVISAFPHVTVSFLPPYLIILPAS